MLSSIYSRKRNDEGFTLIELLIVVIIIGILAAIALPIFINQQKVAVDASVQSDVRNSVTNITNAQAQQATSAKLAQSRTETSLKVYEGTSTDPEPVTSGLTSIPKLGTPYAVEGKNANGLKYASKVFRFDSSTGKFGSADATVPAGVVIASYDFSSGTQGFVASATPSTVETATIDGRAALHLTSSGRSGGTDQGIHAPFNTALKYLPGKTYKVSAWVYMVSPTSSYSAKLRWTNAGEHPIILNTLPTGSWQKVSTTFTEPNYTDYVYPSIYIQTNDSSNIELYLSEISVSQMD